MTANHDIPELAALAPAAIQLCLAREGVLGFQQVKASLGKLGLMAADLPCAAFLEKWALSSTSGKPQQVLESETYNLRPGVAELSIGWAAFPNNEGRALIAFTIFAKYGLRPVPEEERAAKLPDVRRLEGENRLRLT